MNSIFELKWVWALFLVVWILAFFPPFLALLRKSWNPKPWILLTSFILSLWPLAQASWSCWKMIPADPETAGICFLTAFTPFLFAVMAIRSCRNASPTAPSHPAQGPSAENSFEPTSESTSETTSADASATLTETGA